MILDNANILTMDETLPHTKALAIAGGKIIGGVDSREDVIASQAHERINLQGMTVIPGFTESHCHFRSWALKQKRLNLRSITNANDLYDTIQTNSSNDWILGSGWSNHISPDIQEQKLTIAAKGKPLALISFDAHALIINLPALEQLGLTLESLDVSGGIVEKDADGVFTGVLREKSAWIAIEALPMDDLDTKTMATAMRSLAKLGVTSLHDMDGSAALRAWRRLEDERGLTLRVWVHMLRDDLPHLTALGVGGGWGSERLQIGNLKVFADGTMSSNTALLHNPPAQNSSLSPYNGTEVTSVSELKTLALNASHAGMALAIHAIGDLAFTNALDALEATKNHWESLSMSPRIEHAQLTQKKDLIRAAQLGIALSVQPSMLITDSNVLRDYWGSSYEELSFTYNSMINAGCGLIFGSDAPIEELNPLAAIYAAVNRKDLTQDADPWFISESLDPQNALLAATAWPADASGVSHKLGRLLPTKSADLVVLSGDPLKEDISSIEVVATMVEGRWTYGASNLPLR